MIKLLLNIFLILLTFLACYIEDLYLVLRVPLQGEQAALTLRAHQAFDFDQGKALNDKRMAALSHYTPLFSYVPENVVASKNKMQALIERLASYQVQKRDVDDSFLGDLRRELGIEVSRETIAGLIRYKNLKKLLEGVATIQETILKGMILENNDHLKGNNGIEIQMPGSKELVKQPSKDLMTLPQARKLLNVKVKQLSWQVDKEVLEPVLQITAATLIPNLQYNPQGNEKRFEQINQQYPSEVLSFHPGDVFIPFRKIIDEKDSLLINAYLNQRNPGIYREAAWSMFAILFMIVFYDFFLARIHASGYLKKPPYRFLLSLLTFSIILLGAIMLFTPFPIYLLPFSLLPILVISLNHGRIIAIATTLVGAVLISLFMGKTFEIMLFCMFGGLTAVMALSRIQKRSQMIVPSLLVGIINVIFVVILTFDWQAGSQIVAKFQHIGFHTIDELLNDALALKAFWAFVGGVLAGPLALLLLPVFEVGWHTASTFKLNRYTDLQRPLMKKLQRDAPGTYQHCMTVAYLAQAVGENIGANTILLRIGAYYHDIGKMLNPNYYIENQFNGENPHDSMTPNESADTIIDHVKNGVKIALDSHLPKVVVDLVQQHHGTQVMEYFYNLAGKVNPNAELRQEDFRYQGPKPQSIEAAILMIADAVEAASRSLQDPNRKKFEKLVRLIIVKRIADGQLNDCGLDTRDFDAIIQSMADCLEALFHSRVRYPWQEKANKNPATGFIASFEEKDRNVRSFRL